jgi:hypothetical protein
VARAVRISAIGPSCRIGEDHDGHANKTLHPIQPAVRTSDTLEGQLPGWLLHEEFSSLRLTLW